MKFYLLVFIALFGVAGCSTPGDTTTTNETPNTAVSPDGAESPADTGSIAKVNAAPEDALKAFVEALKAKDEKAVLAALSEKTGKMLELQAKAKGGSVLEIFTSMKPEELPASSETRNVKIEGDKATAEVKEPNEDKWSPMAFVKENGSWKLAFGDESYDKSYEEMSKKVESQNKEKTADSSNSNSGAGAGSDKTKSDK